ncbi:hypothetical protein Lalb_Chr23g0272311 [Lupinus albus]|uniref:Uncharacterized protein n=1 Tax=Lupinus albus TaxID=3870 RepID=A0A6A4NEZ0_LUPAL|nr:hypothetical protein Lalb_Chr23g0272311 [Lupinus albus]
MEALINEEHEWFQNRFVVLRKWEPMDVPLERYSWLRCYGILLHAWEENLFKNIASLFGSFLGLDHWTRFNKRLEFSRIFVAIPPLVTVDNVVRLLINKTPFDIKVIEERGIGWDQHKKASSRSSSVDTVSSSTGCSWLEEVLENADVDWNAVEGEDEVLLDADSVGVESSLGDGVDVLGGNSGGAPPIQTTVDPPVVTSLLSAPCLGRHRIVYIYVCMCIHVLIYMCDYIFIDIRMLYV